MHSLKEHNPEMKLTDISKWIANQWLHISDVEKASYQTEAEARIEIYKEERAKYEATYKFKKYKQDLAEWHELYDEEFYDQQHAK